MAGNLNSSEERDNLSTVSTILGLLLFILLVISILTRRIILARRIRAMRARAQHRNNMLFYNVEGSIGLSRDSNGILYSYSRVDG